MELVDLLDRYRIEHRGSEHKHGRSGWVQVDCPYCGPGSMKFHMGFNLSTGAANCWRCGRKRPANVIADLTRETPRRVAQLLSGVRLAKAEATRHTGRLVLPGSRIDLTASRPHVAYLKERGLDPRELEALWKLEAIGMSPRLAWRIFIPIHLDGQIVSWTTRAIGKRVELRYQAAKAEEEAVPHRDLLYGEDYARHAIIIVEGPVDVWRIGPGAVATCGTSYTAAQVLRMTRFPVRAVCFDSDPVAQRRAVELADALSAYPGDTYNITLDAKDAGEADDAEIEELREAILA